jgi:hypothetical protein
LDRRHADGVGHDQVMLGIDGGLDEAAPFVSIARSTCI